METKTTFDNLFLFQSLKSLVPVDLRVWWIFFSSHGLVVKKISEFSNKGPSTILSLTKNKSPVANKFLRPLENLKDNYLNDLRWHMQGQRTKQQNHTKSQYQL
jgi:hypothetical protein